MSDPQDFDDRELLTKASSKFNKRRGALLRPVCIQRPSHSGHQSNILDRHIEPLGIYSTMPVSSYRVLNVLNDLVE